MKFWLLSLGLILLAPCQDVETSGSKRKVYENKPVKTKEMDIRYAYTILYVKNVPKTMEFYQNTFDFKRKMLTPEKDYGEIISGETTIAFANLDLGNSNFEKGFLTSNKNGKPFGIELVFTTSDVEKLVEKALENGARPLADTVLKPWGQTVGYVRDINGFIIEICTPITNEG